MVCLGPFVWRPSLRTCRAARRPPGDFGGIPSPTAVLPATLHVMSWRTCDSATYEIPLARLTAMESPARVHLEHHVEHQAHGLWAVSRPSPRSAAALEGPGHVRAPYLP